MHKIDLVNYKSREYLEAVKVRFKVLRKPFGLKYSKELLSDDRDDTNIVLKTEGKVVGTLILTDRGNKRLQIRQFAVLNSYQSKGFGSALYKFSEDIAKEREYKELILNARKDAVKFYLNMGFEVSSPEYISERTFITHYKMRKKIGS